MKSGSERLEITSSKPLRILCIGDVHSPYLSQSMAKQVIEFVGDFKPTHIVQIGDLYDQYNYGKYPKNPNVDTPKAEDDRGYFLAKEFWTGLSQASPVSCKYQLKGNHCVRVYKKALEKAPELAQAAKDYLDKMFQFKGVRTLADDRSELCINGILFIHGYLANPGDHVKNNWRSTVVGHSHRGGVVYRRYENKTLFELNCGHIADDSELPFAYTPQRTTFWTPGFGTIETLKNGVVAPRFIPL